MAEPACGAANNPVIDLLVEMELPPGGMLGPIAFAVFDTQPLDDEVWLADRVGGAAEVTRATKLKDLGLDGDTLVQVFLDGHEQLQLAFGAEHMDRKKPKARTYGDLQDAFREARRMKDHPHTRGADVPAAGGVYDGPAQQP